jgi:hypothetical protein
LAGKAIDLQKAKRLKEWKDWIAAFVVDYSYGKPVAHAAELLNDYYWRLLDAYLKPMLHYTDDKEHYLHYYKIISASELTVMSVVPFKYAGNDDPETRKQLNAEFACYIAYAIIGNWKIDGKIHVDYDKLEKILNDTEVIDQVNDENKFYPQSLMDEHIEWLKDLNTAGNLPVLSNAQTWRAIFLGSRIDT